MLGITLKRAANGFLIGMAVGNLIAFLTSLSFPGGAVIVAPEFAAAVGSDMAALFIQTLLSGLIGAVSFGGMSLYEIDEWSMAAIMAVHFALICAVFIPVSLILRWLTDALSLVIMAGIMAAAYFVIWLILCAVYRQQVKKLNELQQKMFSEVNDNVQ